MYMAQTTGVAIWGGRTGGRCPL